MMAITYQPMPMAMPIAAANQMAAAVVRFLTVLLSLLRIMPAPRKPTPDTTWAAIRAGLLGSATVEMKVNRHAPAITKQCVLMPAGLSRISRSTPIIVASARHKPSLIANTPS